MHADKQFRKELMSLAIPFALQWLLNALVGASDALMLGRLTQESIAAVSLANQVSFVLSLFIGAIVGAIGVLVAQYYGKGDFDTVRNLLSMALRYVLVLTVIFFLLAFFLPEHLMTVFTDEQDLIAIGASYLRIVSFSYLFQGASQCYLMLMKVDGRAKVSVWISAVTVVVDMTADYFLIYGAGKLPALGANGSAYSTIAVEVIALCWCVAASYQKGRIHPNSRSLRFFSPRLEKDMLRIAFPMLASSLSWGLSIVAHSVIIGHMGTDATAAYSVTNVATSLIQCLSQGFAIHDYSPSGEMLRAHLGSMDTILALRPAQRALFVGRHAYAGQPILLSEFGGVKFVPGTEAQHSWGYCEADSCAAFAGKLRELFDAVRACPLVDGYCYTQLTDVETEQNGLLTYDRTPKLPLETICAILNGRTNEHENL